MSLQFETVTFPFVKGVNTKADPKAMEMPNLTKCENALFDEVGSIQKRTGFSLLANTNADGGADLARRRGVGTRRNELLLFAEGRAYSWSDNDSEWQDRSRFESVLVDQKQVFHDRSDQVDADRCEAGGVILYAWRDRQAGGVRWRCVDKSTGSVFSSASEPFLSGAEKPKCRAINGKLILFLLDSSGARLRALTISPTDVYGTINGSITTLTTDVANKMYDVDVMGTNYVIAWNTTTATTYKIGEYNTNHVAQVGPVTHARDATDGIAVYHEPTNDRVSLARVEDNTNDHVRHDWLVGSSLGVDTAFDTSLTAETDGKVLNLTTVALQNGASYQAFVMWDVKGSDRRDDLVKRCVVDVVGTTTVRVLIRHALLGSRARLWTDGTTERPIVHVLYGYASSIQPTYFLLDANFVVGELNGTRSAGEEVGLLARLLPAQAQDDTFFTNLPQIEDLGSNKFASTLINRRRLVAEDALGDPVYIHAERGIVDFGYEFANSAAYRGVEEGNSLYLPGGYVAVYDGVKVTESGFFLAPELEAGDFSGTSGGSIASNSDYTYIAVWERFLANGERQLSSWVGSVTVSTGANNKFNITIHTLGATNDDNAQLALYRSEANPGKDAAYHRVTSFNPSDVNYAENDPNADTVSLSDTLSDAALILQEPFPFNPSEFGTPLDSVPPPPTKYITSGQDRLFTIDPEDPDRVWFSKIRLQGSGVEFSDALSLDVPQQGGKVVAVEATDSGIVIFKEKAIYYVAGQGPDNLGLSPYPVPQPLSNAIGCKDPASVIRIHNGVLFKSEKGVYLLDNSLNLVFVGAGIDAYTTTDTVKGAADVPDKHYVLFLGDTSGAFMYNYLLNEWSLWPSVIGESMVVWDGDISFLHANGVYHHSSSLFQDNSTEYSLHVETAWIRLANLPRYHKATWYEILTEWKDNHDLEVKVAYDLDESAWTDTWQWAYPTAVETAGKRASFLYRFTQMKTPAVKFSIRDISDGLNDLLESMKLNHIAIKMAVMPKFGGVGTAQTSISTGTIIDPG